MKVVLMVISWPELVVAAFEFFVNVMVCHFIKGILCGTTRTVPIEERCSNLGDGEYEWGDSSTERRHALFDVDGNESYLRADCPLGKIQVVEGCT